MISYWTKLGKFKEVFMPLAWKIATRGNSVSRQRLQTSNLIITKDFSKNDIVLHREQVYCISALKTSLEQSNMLLLPEHFGVMIPQSGKNHNYYIIYNHILNCNCHGNWQTNKYIYHHTNYIFNT